MNFSVCIIMKNEEKTLPRLGASLKPFLDAGGEWLALDTGSTDRTVEVAKSLGAKVIEVGSRFVEKIPQAISQAINKEFVVEGETDIVKEDDTVFNYSAARNFIAAQASNDMIAMPDADETYTTFDLQKIQDEIAGEVEQLEYQFVFSHFPDGSPSMQFLHCKFYNRTKLHWVGIIHEVLQGEANRKYLAEDIIKLEHFQNLSSSRGHYLKGLALDCYLNPTNDRNSHYFGRELMYQGQWKSAIQELERHIAMQKWPAERSQSMIYIGDCYGKLNEPEKQVSWYHKAFYLDDTRRESLLKLAEFFKHNNNPRSAAVYAAASLEIDWQPYYHNFQGHYTYIPHEILYWAKGWMGDMESAKKHLLKALEYQPDNSVYYRDARYYWNLPTISIVLPTLGRPEGLKRCLDSIQALNYPQELIETIVLEDSPRIGVPKRVKEGVEKSKHEVIMFASNDIEIHPDALMIAVLAMLNENKSLVAFDSGRENECEHFIIKKEFISQIDGEIFDTEFHHVGVDNLLMAKAQKLNQFLRCKGKVKHYHFSLGYEMDEVAKMGWSHVEKDRELLQTKLELLNSR